MTTPRANARISAATKSLGVLEGQAVLLRAEVTQLQAMLAGLRDTATPQPQEVLLQANEHLVLAALQAQAIAEEAERRRDAAALASQRDALTDTPNRTLMLDRLHQAIAIAQRQNTHLAVLFVDIDGFKQINDTFGHPVGDRVLQCVARRLASAVRKSDTVGRFGGEEFLVLLDDLATTADVPDMAEHLLEILAQPRSIVGHAIQLSASLGIAFYPDDAQDAASLIACSDAAMYRAKRRGPGGYEFSHNVPDGSMETNTQARTDRAQRQHAKRQGEHVLHDALQEANAHLVISALHAQAQEGEAREAHARQLKSMVMVAHELRNPLAPIRVAAGMLDRARDDLAQFTWLQQIIEGQVTHIARLVDDLLDGSRVSTGKLHLEREQVDLRRVLETAVHTCRPAMETRHQQLLVDLPPDAMPLHGDRTRLVQVFTNLLDNASKYTPEGGRITLATVQSNDAVTVSVSDNGIGISDDALPHVFDLFVQDSRAVALRKGGLGIGLAVVRELVEAHGGTVVGTSGGKDMGSTFAVTLPIPIPLATSPASR